MLRGFCLASAEIGSALAHVRKTCLNPIRINKQDLIQGLTLSWAGPRGPAQPASRQPSGATFAVLQLPVLSMLESCMPLCASLQYPACVNDVAGRV